MISVYLSGAVTSLGIESARSTFDRYERELDKASTITTVNPLDAVPFVEGKSWFYYMWNDLKVLRKCDAIAMLPNWRQSLGAKIERIFAMLCGKMVFYVKDVETSDGELYAILKPYK